MIDRPPRVLLDVWGVLHDGRVPYPDAQRFLDRMERAGTDVRLVSNASWTARALREHLASLGFRLSAVQQIFTAGDEARHLVRELQPRGVFYEGLAEPVEGVPQARLEQCDLVVFANLTGRSKEVLSHALERGVPIVCANPDVAIWDRLGRAIPKAGGLAQAFADRGATVHFAGKPSPGIFRRAAPEGAPLIGDSPATDLAGAQGADLPSIWLLRRPRDDVARVQARFRPLATVASLDALW